MSSGFRLETRLPSSTTGSSTYSAPAFSMSTRIDGQPATRRPRRTLAVISSCGAWQIRRTGLPLSTNRRTNSTTAGSIRSLSGEWPPGMKSASNRSTPISPAERSTRTAVPCFPFTSSPPARPTTVTVCPAFRKASTGFVDPTSSNSFPTSAAMVLMHPHAGGGG